VNNNAPIFTQFGKARNENSRAKGGLIGLLQTVGKKLLGVKKPECHRPWCSSAQI